MRSIGISSREHRRGATPHRGIFSVLTLVAVCLLPLAVTQAASAEPVADPGFAIPFSGAPGFEHLAPTLMTSPDQLNQPLGQQAADEIAGQIGLSSADALSEQQYRDLMAGGGVGKGNIVGASDKIAGDVASTPVSPKDILATILHLLGIDHERMTFKFQGRRYRLTDVHGQVVKGVLA